MWVTLTFVFLITTIVLHIRKNDWKYAANKYKDTCEEITEIYQSNIDKSHEIIDTYKKIIADYELDKTTK